MNTTINAAAARLSHTGTAALQMSTVIDKPRTANPRMQAAKEFAVAAATRDYVNAGDFVMGLRGYLKCRDIAYPHEARFPVNERQCVAIFMHAKPAQTKSRKKAS